MSRIAIISILAATLAACQEESSGGPRPQDEANASAADVQAVAIDLASLCTDDLPAALDLLATGTLQQHEIFDAFEPCQPPAAHHRPWGGVEDL